MHEPKLIFQKLSHHTPQCIISPLPSFLYSIDVPLYVSYSLKYDIMCSLYSNGNYLQFFKSIKQVEKHINKFLYIFSSIYFITKTDKSITSESFLSLHSKKLEKVLTERQRIAILNYLISNGYLESDKYYILGKKSIGYRLGIKWRKLAILGELPFYKDSNSKIKMTVKYTSQDLYIHNLLNTITLDKEKVKIARQNILNSPEKLEQFDFIEDCFNDKAHFIKRGENGRRMFNLITSMPRYLRSAIIFPNKGKIEQELFNCDIKSCQPLLLCTLYQEYTEEFFKYKNLVESGNFYKDVVEYLKLEYNEENKEKYKNLIWQWLFGRYTSKDAAVILKYFADSFPILKSIITKIKSPVNGKNSRSHCQLAILLQKTESSIIIDDLISFAAERNIPMLPIHDSFLCHKENIDKLINKTKEIMMTRFSLVPNFNIQKL